MMIYKVFRIIKQANIKTLKLKI